MEPVKLWWVNSRNQKLFAWYAKPKDEPKALICLVHGHGEHSYRYLHWAERFVNHGYAFMSWDHVGHGLSEGQRGHTLSYEHLLLEIDIALSKAAELFPDYPVVLYGHSMGGNLAMNYSLRRCCGVKLIISTSPWIRLAKPVPVLLEMVGYLLNLLFPIFPMKSSVLASDISHLEIEVKKYSTDPLIHNRITPRLYFAIKKAGRYFLNRAGKNIIPMLVMHGDGDLVTSFVASKEAAQRTPRSKFVSWPGMYHELHNESIRVQVFVEILSWVEQRLKE